MSRAKKAESTAKPKDKLSSQGTPATPPKESQANSHPDWERIEIDYRAGVKTLRQIADEHNIAHGTIRKRANKHGWERDLSAKIRQKAESLVSKAAVSKPVSTESKVSEREVVEANALAITNVRLAHRQDIQKARRIAMALLEELEQETGQDQVNWLKQLGELMFKPDDKGIDRLNEIYHKVISLPGRAKTMKDLGESVRVLVELERKAFGLDDKDNQTADPLQKLLDSISSRNASSFQPVATDPDHEPDDA